jgi:hypothetical protein
LYERYLKDAEFQKIEYEVHQLGLKSFGTIIFKNVEGLKKIEFVVFEIHGKKSLKSCYFLINRKLRVATEIGSTFFGCWSVTEQLKK